MRAAINKVIDSAATVDRASNVLSALYDHVHSSNGVQEAVVIDVIETVRELLGCVRDELDAVEVELNREHEARAAADPKLVAAKVARRPREAPRRG